MIRGGYHIDAHHEISQKTVAGNLYNLRMQLAAQGRIKRDILPFKSIFHLIHSIFQQRNILRTSLSCSHAGREPLINFPNVEQLPQLIKTQLMDYSAGWGKCGRQRFFS